MGKNLAKAQYTFLFCDGGSCQKAGSEAAVREARAYLRNAGLWDQTHTIKTRCNGRCEDAPTCIVHPGNHWYKQLDAEQAVRIVKSHVEQDKPLRESLLYSEGWDALDSAKERPPAIPKPFTRVTDAQLGDCYLTKGFSSEQYLHPLFRHILEQKPKGTLAMAGAPEVALDALRAVVFTHENTMDLHFGMDTLVQLVIGKVTSTATEAVMARKITGAEYYWQPETRMCGIRFKNKKTEWVGMLRFPAEDALWDYCLRIMLGGMESPKVAERA